MSDNQVLLKVDGLVKHFPVLRGVFQRQVGAVHAVDGVSFDIRQGETLGLVGESGCGKSTTGRTILQLYKPTSGHVYYRNQDLVGLKPEAMRMMRREMQMIFQDPYASLNPRMTVEQMGTTFGGTIDLAVQMAADGSSLTVDAALTKLAVKPKEIRIRLRSGDGRPLASATVNGQPAKVLPGDTIQLPLAKTGDYRIEARFY